MISFLGRGLVLTLWGAMVKLLLWVRVSLTIAPHKVNTSPLPRKKIRAEFCS